MLLTLPFPNPPSRRQNKAHSPTEPITPLSSRPLPSRVAPINADHITLAHSNRTLSLVRTEQSAHTPPTHRTSLSSTPPGSFRPRILPPHLSRLASPSTASLPPTPTMDILLSPHPARSYLPRRIRPFHVCSSAPVAFSSHHLTSQRCTARRALQESLIPTHSRMRSVACTSLRVG